MAAEVRNLDCVTHKSNGSKELSQLRMKINAITVQKKQIYHNKISQNYHSEKINLAFALLMTAFGAIVEFIELCL